MSADVESAYSRFQGLEAEIKAALDEEPNEADTRLKALDRLLFEVFGWSHEAVFTEPHTESGYLDYLLTIGERRNAMVIEAKKAGLLEPATKSKEVTFVGLSGPVVKPLMAGIKQALGGVSYRWTSSARREGHSVSKLSVDLRELRSLRRVNRRPFCARPTASRSPQGRRGPHGWRCRAAVLCVRSGRSTYESPRSSRS